MQEDQAGPSVSPIQGIYKPHTNDQNRIDGIHKVSLGVEAGTPKGTGPSATCGKVTMTKTGSKSISRLARSAPAAPTDGGTLPDLKFMAPRVINHGFGSIAIGDGSSHHINNMGEFYAALGFKDNGGGGLLPEEFIWDRYTRDGASKSMRCLQIQIGNYLYTHSARFKELYGCAHEKMIGTCKSEHIDDRDGHCLKCPMHPTLRHCWTSH